MSIRLPDDDTPSQVCAPTSDAAPSVLDLGTTARAAKSQGEVGRITLTPDPKTLAAWHREARAKWRAEHPHEDSEADSWTAPARELPAWCSDIEWSEDMEHVWRERTREAVRALTRRARRYRAAAKALLRWQECGGPPPSVPGTRQPSTTRAQLRALCRGDERRIKVTYGHGAITADGRRVELMKAAEWCAHRAQAISMTRRDIVSACRGRWRSVSCGCGPRDVEVGCDQPMLCAWCRKRHWLQWRRRITRAMGPHLRAALDAWNKAGARGPRPGIFLVTLTAPHSGDLVIDRRVMGEAWRELSKRASYGGYEHGGRTFEDKWWGHHAMVYEVTNGTRGDGHLHAHAAVISQWVPYAELRAAWQAAIPGAVVVDVVSPQAQAARANARGRKSNGPGDAAFYLAKYVTKGVEPGELSGRKAGEMLVAFRGRRKVTTSRHFWRPNRDREQRCKGCGERHILIGSPDSLREHAPLAVMRSLWERSRFKPPRIAPQVRVRW